jgi:hypothetical protein
VGQISGNRVRAEHGDWRGAIRAPLWRGARAVFGRVRLLLPLVLNEGIRKVTALIGRILCWAGCFLLFPLISLRLVRSWLFERRCLSLRVFDYNGYSRAVALIRYTGETIATDGEGIAIPCNSHFGRCVDVIVLPDVHWSRFRDNHTFTRVTFQKHRWEDRWFFHCIPGVSVQAMLRILEEAGIEGERYDLGESVEARLACDMLLVRDEREVGQLKRKLDRLFEEKACQVMATAARCAS